MPNDLTFEQELAALINKYSLENESNTPDFVLALFLKNCLAAFSHTITLRDNWNGAENKPAKVEDPFNQNKSPLEVEAPTGDGSGSLRG